MKFLALLRKELRECLPWMLLAFLAMLLINGIVFQADLVTEFKEPLFSPTGLLQHDLPHPWILFSDVGPILLFASVALGLILAARQYLMDYFTKTWGFALHRSVTRSATLASKIFAAIIAFVVSIGSVWTALYICVHNPALFRVPPTLSIFLEGWLFIAIGFVIYLGAAVTIISTAQWYTTRIFPLAFAASILFSLDMQWSVAEAVVVIVLLFLVLLTQLVVAFTGREF